MYMGLHKLRSYITVTMINNLSIFRDTHDIYLLYLNKVYLLIEDQTRAVYNYILPYLCFNRHQKSSHTLISTKIHYFYNILSILGILTSYCTY